MARRRKLPRAPASGGVGKLARAIDQSIKLGRGRGARVTPKEPFCSEGVITIIRERCRRMRVRAVSKIVLERAAEPSGSTEHVLAFGTARPPLICVRCEAIV